jgi:micrococcal nuclease
MASRTGFLAAHAALPLALTFVGLVGLAVSGCAGSSRSAETTRSGPGAAVVERVVDGDTLVARVGSRDERVRLIGIDTPETVSPVKPVQCYGKEASNHLKALLTKGTPVRLVGDAEGRDRYGRLLAYVYRQRDGLFVNLELATDGFASLLTYPPNVAHLEQLTTAVDDARAHGRGLWGRCGGPGVPIASGA